MFDRLVDLTEPICQRIDPNLDLITIFDTSEIEAWVIENNPKYANRIIKQLKAFAKANNFDKNYDPYKAAYVSCQHMLQQIQPARTSASSLYRFFKKHPQHFSANLDLEKL